MTTGALDQLKAWVRRWPDAENVVDPIDAMRCLGRVAVDVGGELPDESAHGFASGSVALGRLDVLGCRAEAATTVTFEESSDRYLFFLPVAGGIEVAQRQRAAPARVEPGRIAILPALTQAKVSLDAGTGLLVIVVPQSALLEGIETLAGAPVNGHVTFDDECLPVASPVGMMLLGLLQLLEPVCMEQSLFHPRRALLERVESMMVLSLVSALPHNFTQDTVGEPPPSVAPAVVSMAEAYMRKNAAEAITLDDIAAATGYGVRTLQLAFRRFRYTTPMAQLRRIRLDLIHDELTKPDEDTTVSSAARAWQFPNTGRMAKRFHEIYGETPQEVLRRGRRTNGVDGKVRR